MIPLFMPSLLREDWLASLGEIFKTRWIGQGPQVDAFEKAFGEKYGFKYCLALNSCTAALALAYKLLGIGPGDVVLVPVLTCTATNIPLLHLGAKLVFVDVDKTTLTMNAADFREKLTEEVKAVVTTNLAGVPCSPNIYAWARSKEVPVVVDAAQSLGIGEHQGDLVCYSFQAIKHFTTGDGGMLCMRDGALYERAKKLRWFGIDREAKRNASWRCIADHKMTMDIEEPGFKYHMNDVAATMGLVGLDHADTFLSHRYNVMQAYMRFLKDKVRCVYGGSLWLFCILVENRDELAEILRKEGIECDLVHLRNDIFAAFGGKRRKLPNMNWVESRYLYLPIHNSIDVATAEEIAKCVLRYAQ